jgi:glutamate:Na+ symporter, ESS family
MQDVGKQLLPSALGCTEGWRDGISSFAGWCVFTPNENGDCVTENIVHIQSFMAFTIGILVYFAGMSLNARVAVLKNFNIPEPVTVGILASLTALGLFLAFDIELEYDLEVRDRLMVYFFTAIGLNARFKDLIEGGRPLVILLVLTLGYIVLQDVIGVSVATLMGEPSAMGVLAGSASLIGGHGTTIAWAPEIAASHGVPNALEIGVAAATLGLVVASLLGGPIARYLLSRHAIAGIPGDQDSHLFGVPHEREEIEVIDHVSIMSVLLTLHVAIILGFFLDQAFAATGLKLPLFVSCLLVAILLTNPVPKLVPRLRWPARTRALALVSDFSLGIFIAMSLMGMQLWSLGDLAGPLLILLGGQVVATVLFILFVVFPLNRLRRCVL